VRGRRGTFNNYPKLAPGQLTPLGGPQRHKSWFVDMSIVPNTVQYRDKLVAMLTIARGGGGGGEKSSDEA